MFKRWMLAILPLLCFGASSVHALTVREDLWHTDGTIWTSAVSGNLLYIGGSFTYVGALTGPAPVFDATTGELQLSPRVSGLSKSVWAVVSDGAGGWFIGGSFDQVNGVPRSNIAHVLADNSVAAWNPGCNGQVNAILVVGSTVYVGGSFSLFDGQGRSNLAACDANTGAVTSWNPGANSFVLALASDGSTIYAGGQFSTAGGQSRNRIAAIDATTGAATAWDPNPTGGFGPWYVRALAVNGSTVYAGGGFTSIGFQFRNGIAALDATTGAATTWNPNPPGADVFSIAVSGSVVYVAGGFSTMGGQSRPGLAALDAATASATSWNPNPNPGGARTVTVDGSTVYVGGGFSTIGGQSRQNVAAIDAASGSATAWSPSVGQSNQFVNAIAPSGSNVLVGGTFSMAGGVPRQGIAAIDLTTGKATAWNPTAGGTIPEVYAISVQGSLVYVAGDFGIIGGQPRLKLAALDATTGNATSWDPSIVGTVYTMDVSGSTVYVGGTIQSVHGTGRNKLAGVDVTTGNPTAFNPNGDNTVRVVKVSGSTVYAGGSFTIIGGQSRHGIAALDAATGNATAWDPSAGGTVYSLALSGSTIYAGGQYTFIGGQGRTNLAALDVGTGSALSWNPGANANVQVLGVSGSTVYAAGSFTTIGGQPRNCIAALDAGTGSVLDWNPNANATVLTVSLDGPTVYLGGSFATVGGIPRQRLAGISDPVVGVPRPGFEGGGSLALASHPNPFHRSTEVWFSLPREAEVTLSVHDVAGRVVRKLANGRSFSAGPHVIEFDGRGLPSGVYVCLLRAGGQSTTQRMVLIP